MQITVSFAKIILMSCENYFLLNKLYFREGFNLTPFVGHHNHRGPGPGPLGVDDLQGDQVLGVGLQLRDHMSETPQSDGANSL